MILNDPVGNVARVDGKTGGIYTTGAARRFIYEEQLEADEWSEIVLIPSEYSIDSISYDLQTQGTATVQATISSIESILAGNAVWRDIPENVRVNTSVVAMRGRALGAVGTLIIRAQ